MTLNKKDYSIRWYRGQGPGGQHRQKTENACEITHISSGITANADHRSRKESKRQALKNLEKRIEDAKAEKIADQKKSDRDLKVHNTKIIRTYNYPRGTVKDHRSKKSTALKKMMDGKVDLKDLSTDEEE